MIEASAPAKLALLGEYAVLEGAPALVAAVDRRVRVRFSPTAGPTWQLGSDLGPDRRVPLLLDPDAREDAPWRAFPATILRGLFRRHGLPLDALPAQQVEITSRALTKTATGQKLGLGSSAAVATALTAAWHALRAHTGAPAGEPVALSPEVLFADAFAGHRETQDGRGSGMDVAASVYGGTLEFRLGSAGPVVEPLALPPSLAMRVVWTGQAASTRIFLGGIRAFESTNPTSFRTHMATLRALAERGLTACRRADARGFLAAVDAYREGLAALGDDAGLPILSAPHLAIATRARAGGAACKPSGAGGGDTALLFAESESTLQSLIERLAEAGYPSVKTGITTMGATVRHLERQAP